MKVVSRGAKSNIPLHSLPRSSLSLSLSLSLPPLSLSLSLSLLLEGPLNSSNGEKLFWHEELPALAGRSQTAGRSDAGGFRQLCSEGWGRGDVSLKCQRGKNTKWGKKGRDTSYDTTKNVAWAVLCFGIMAVLISLVKDAFLYQS